MSVNFNEFIACLSSPGDGRTDVPINVNLLYHLVFLQVKHLVR